MSKLHRTSFGRFFFALCFLLVPLSAHALGLEIGAGVAQYQAAPNGNWYEEGLPHSLGLRAPALMIGATGDISPHLAWHLDVVSLGSVAVDSWDVPADATQYSWVTKSCIGPCPPLIHVLGSGSIYGLTPTLEGYALAHGWRFGVEAGPFLFRQSLSLSVPNWDAQTNGSATDPTWTHADGQLSYSRSGWGVGSVIGLSIERSGLGLSLRQYRAARNQGFPPFWTTQTVLMLTYAF